jgi:hypothetical protein
MFHAKILHLDWGALAQTIHDEYEVFTLLRSMAGLPPSPRLRRTRRRARPCFAAEINLHREGMKDSKTARLPRIFTDIGGKIWIVGVLSVSS